MLFLWLVLSLLPISVASNYAALIFPFANASQIRRAYSIGAEARHNLSKEIDVERDESAKMELFAHHFMSCSTVGNELQEYIDSLLDIQSQGHSPKESLKKKILQAAGFDAISSNLFIMNYKDIEKTINTACLKNELQLQCAYGFMNDYDKIQEHITELKKTDGNLKVMFEKECKNPQLSPKLYSCIGKHVHFVKNQCALPFLKYNQTRRAVNNKIEVISQVSHRTLNKILTRYERTADEDLLIEANNQLRGALREVSFLEDQKCVQFLELSACFEVQMANYCGQDTLNVLDTVLRVGYLRRERDTLNSHVQIQQQFEQMEVPPSPNCIPLV
uniref:Secreted protein n=1 Tax=Bursaphelenchus xylophilus TaxID=6326 RepID=A0A1I7SA90_BURXY